MEPTMEAGVEAEGVSRPLGGVVQIDEGRIQSHLDEVVRATVEETLNALLDAEADHLCGALKYERTEGRKDTRAGSYDRHLHTKAGEVLSGWLRVRLAAKKLIYPDNNLAMPFVPTFAMPAISKR